MTMTFEGGICKVYEGRYTNDILLPFSSYEKFNGMMDKSSFPIPVKGFRRQSFLHRNFSMLSSILKKYLGSNGAEMYSGTFQQDSVNLLFHVFINAAAQVANHDVIGRCTVSGIADGDIVISIKNGPQAALRVDSQNVKRLQDVPENPTARLEFSCLEVARDVFERKQIIPYYLGTGQIQPEGHIGLLQPLYRLMDRVAVYLS